MQSALCVLTAADLECISGAGKMHEIPLWLPNAVALILLIHYLLVLLLFLWVLRLVLALLCSTQCISSFTIISLRKREMAPRL